MKKTTHSDKGSTLVLRTKGHGGDHYVLCDAVSARHTGESRSTGRAFDLGPMGKCPIHEPTGKVYKDRVTLSCSGASASCDYTGQGLKTVLRAVRPQELAEIEAARAEVAKLRELSRQASERLSGLCVKAFREGHYVPVSSLSVSNADKPGARRR